MTTIIILFVEVIQRSEKDVPARTQAATLSSQLRTNQSNFWIKYIDGMGVIYNQRDPNLFFFTITFSNNHTAKNN